MEKNNRSISQAQKFQKSTGNQDIMGHNMPPEWVPPSAVSHLELPDSPSERWALGEHAQAPYRRSWRWGMLSHFELENHHSLVWTSIYKWPKLGFVEGVCVCVVFSRLCKLTIMFRDDCFFVQVTQAHQIQMTLSATWPNTHMIKWHCFCIFLGSQPKIQLFWEPCFWCPIGMNMFGLFPKMSSHRQRWRFQFLLLHHVRMCGWFWSLAS